jgi:hypothetical protein
MRTGDEFLHGEDETATDQRAEQNATRPKREIRLVDFRDIEARLDWTWLVDGLLMPEQLRG